MRRSQNRDQLVFNSGFLTTWTVNWYKHRQFDSVVNYRCKLYSICYVFYFIYTFTHFMATLQQNYFQTWYSFIQLCFSALLSSSSKHVETQTVTWVYLLILVESRLKTDYICTKCAIRLHSFPSDLLSHLLLKSCVVFAIFFKKHTISIPFIVYLKLK